MVVGAHGTSGIAALVLGSVADRRTTRPRDRRTVLSGRTQHRRRGPGAGAAETPCGDGDFDAAEDGQLVAHVSGIPAGLPATLPGHPAAMAPRRYVVR